MSVLTKKYPSIKGYYQHGFNPTEETGSNQLVGNCIFCGKKGHFYVNPEKKKWDCKKCGSKGGFKTFLNKVVEWSEQFFEKSVALDLTRNRGIKLSILRDAKIGYNPLTDEYIVPAFDQTGEDVYDVKRYTKKRFWSTAGCRKSLYGWEKIINAKTIWLCEGEWDSLRCRTFINNEEEISVAVPGGDIFMADWAQLFKEKHVIVVYDNDDTGQRGMRKVYGAIGSLAESIQFVHWPEGREKGFDLRDQCKGKKSLKSVIDLLRPTPPGMTEETKETLIEKNKTKFSGAGITCDEVYAAFREVFYMKDTTVLDAMYGSIIANRLDGDPLWLFIVGPPGSLKTELLITLVNSPAIETASSLTPQSLVSGANFSGGGDPSLIPKLNDKVLIVKDFTTILNMNPMQRDDIFGILRDAYDGRTEKVFGNGVTRVYESKFGIVAGVTPAIELYIEGNTAMGERFLTYRIPVIKGIAAQREMVKRAISNVGKEKGKREGLRAISNKVLNYNYTIQPEIQDEYIEKIISLAQWIAMMRGTIVRDKYTKEITHKPFTEYATRLSKQLCKHLIGICMFKRLKKVTDTEFAIIQGIAYGTVPSRMLDMCKVAIKADNNSIDTPMCMEATGLPRTTCERVLEDLTLLKILEKEKMGRLAAPQWVLRRDVKKLIKGAGLYV